MGLTRESVPGLATAVYLTLTLSSLFYALTSKPLESDGCVLALMALTFPYSFFTLFVLYIFDPPVAPPLWFFVWLFLAFTIANAFAVHRVSRSIVGRD